MKKTRKVFRYAPLYRSRHLVQKYMKEQGYAYEEYSIIQIKPGIFTPAIHGYIPGRLTLEFKGDFKEICENELTSEEGTTASKN